MALLRINTEISYANIYIHHEVIIISRSNILGVGGIFDIVISHKLQFANISNSQYL